MTITKMMLLERIKKVYASIGMRLPTLECGGDVIDIDPFTIFGLFNKGITNTNRINVITGFAKEFGVTATVPESFDGIPVLNNQSAAFYYFLGDRGEHDIDNLWDSSAPPWIMQKALQEKGLVTAVCVLSTREDADIMFGSLP